MARRPSTRRSDCSRDAWTAPRWSGLRSATSPTGPWSRCTCPTWAPPHDTPRRCSRSRIVRTHFAHPLRATRWPWTPDQNMLTPLKQPATQSVLLQSIISGGRVTRRDSVPAMPTSQALDWPGILLEAGKNDVAAVDDVVGDRHYVSLNIDTRPLTLEVKGSTGFRAFTIPPLSVWVSPGHDPLTMRLDSALRYVRGAGTAAARAGRTLGGGQAPGAGDDRRPIGCAVDGGHAGPRGRAVAGALCARFQGDDRAGAPPISAVAAARPRTAAARAVRCRPVGHRTAHGLRRPGSLHPPLQTGLPRDSGRPDASVAVLSFAHTREREMRRMRWIQLAAVAVMAACNDYRATAPAPVPPEATVFSATGMIGATVNQFRAILGAPNGGTAGEQPAGRREINWDGAAAIPFNNRT